MANKLFAGAKISNNNMFSKVKANREYLISQEIAEDLNTYNYFGVFYGYNDVHKRKFRKGDKQYSTYGVTKGENGNKIKESGSFTQAAWEEDFSDPNISKIGSPSVRSIFNRAGGMMLGTDGSIPANIKNIDVASHIRNDASGWRISNNVPLMDSPNVRQKIKEHSGCSVKELVEKSAEGLLGRAIYSYADFMYCKYLGKVPNNYLITLRRFPVPPGDFISTVGSGIDSKREGKNNNVQQIGCMVTWMGTPGNEMNNILKYSYKMPYQEKKSEWNNIDSGGADGATGLANSIAAAFDPAYRQQYMSGHGGAAFNAYIGKFFKCENGPYPAQSGFYDANKIYGPIDRVKSTMMRSDEGLEFEQNITLTFEYELRAYNGINTRQAMLDLLSNILQVTYTSGGFWGGGYRGGGMHQSSIFNNLAIFKAHGGFTSFMDAFSTDVSTVSEKIGHSVTSQGGWLSTIKNLLNQLGGMILGGMLNKLGRPQRAYANSLLSEQPVGMWHLMVGNPNHPIISIGNMVLTNTEVQHYGPLGLDDFPTNLKVTCTLKRGKPRDLREIEKMYMHGNDRIYFSMGPKVMDMYKRAAEYKASRNKSGGKTATTHQSDNDGSYQNIYVENKTIAEKYDKELELDTSAGVEATATTENTSDSKQAQQTQTVKSNDLKDMAVVELTDTELSAVGGKIQKWFGETDTYSIYFAAAEQENGASKKKASSNDGNGGNAETGQK